MITMYHVLSVPSTFDHGTLTSLSFGSFFIPSKALSFSSLCPHGNEPTTDEVTEEVGIDLVSLLLLEMLGAWLLTILSFPFTGTEELVFLLKEGADVSWSFFSCVDDKETSPTLGTDTSFFSPLSTGILEF